MTVDYDSLDILNLLILVLRSLVVSVTARKNVEHSQHFPFRVPCTLGGRVHDATSLSLLISSDAGPVPHVHRATR